MGRAGWTAAGRFHTAASRLPPAGLPLSGSVPPAAVLSQQPCWLPPPRNRKLPAPGAASGRTDSRTGGSGHVCTSRPLSLPPGEGAGGGRAPGGRRPEEAAGAEEGGGRAPESSFRASRRAWRGQPFLDAAPARAGGVRERSPPPCSTRVRCQLLGGLRDTEGRTAMTERPPRAAAPAPERHNIIPSLWVTPRVCVHEDRTVWHPPPPLPRGSPHPHPRTALRPGSPALAQPRAQPRPRHPSHAPLPSHTTSTGRGRRTRSPGSAPSSGLRHKCGVDHHTVPTQLPAAGPTALLPWLCPRLALRASDARP